MEAAMIDACKENNLELACYLLSVKEDLLKVCAKNAAIHSSLDIIEYLVEDYDKNNPSENLIDIIFLNGCAEGQVDVIKYVVQEVKVKDITFINGFINACRCDKLNMVRYIMEECKYTKDIIDINIVNTGMRDMCYDNNVKGAEYLIKKHNANAFNLGLQFASYNSSILSMKYMIECGATETKHLELEDVYHLLNMGVDYRLLGELTSIYTTKRNERNAMIKTVLLDYTNLCGDVILSVCDYTEY